MHFQFITFLHVSEKYIFSFSDNNSDTDNKIDTT